MLAALRPDADELIVTLFLPCAMAVQSKEQQLKDHQENKHPKATFEVSCWLPAVFNALLCQVCVTCAAILLVGHARVLT